MQEVNTVLSTKSSVYISFLCGMLQMIETPLLQAPSVANVKNEFRKKIPTESKYHSTMNIIEGLQL